MEIPGLAELTRADPAAARRLEVWGQQLAAGLDAAEWAAVRLPAICAAGSRSAALAALVDLTRAELSTAEVCALWWSGDLRSGTSSFRLLAGSAGALPGPDRISRTIVAQAASASSPVWTDDARTDPRFASAESVLAGKVGAVGCVPLPPDGALYVALPVGESLRSRSKLRLEAFCRLVAAVLAGEEAPRPAPAQAIPGLIGTARPMIELYAAIRAFAPMPWPVLVLGETGTGKEAVAHAVHALAGRGDAPLIAVNCATIPDDLAESTFCGHERGAFTGAERRKDGLLERTGAGTLFLDEVGELSPRVQAKLLRVLQEGVYERLGGDAPLRFRGRIVAATHRPLERADRVGFRADLFHRLSACVLRVPSLHERREDIPALAAFLLERALAQVPGAPPLRLGSSILRTLQQRDWPGNVRELENALRGGVARAVAWGDAEILREHLDLQEPEAPAEDHETREVADGGLLAATDRFQRRVVREALDAVDGNRQEAAKRLGVSRQWLYRLLSRWGGDA